MATMEVTAENIESVINDNSIVILDFWASWCGPCKSFAPTFEKASEEHPDVVFGKIDTEAQRQLSAQLQISSIPTVMVFRDQIQLYYYSGNYQDELAISFIGTDAFTGTAGEARYEQFGSYTMIFVDVDGDAVADGAIRVDGIHDFLATDFIL